MAEHQQTLKEEVANSITHGLGILFCLIAIPALLIYAFQHGSLSTFWAVSIFGFGMLMVYTSSTLFHAIQSTRAKNILQVWDHISIYLLIAGSYTPVVMIYTNTDISEVFLSVMWGIVAVASFLKIFYTRKFKMVSLMLYLALGWMALFIAGPLFANMPSHIFWWILAGGLAYTLGTIFYIWRSLQYHHAIWHVFVLAGTVTHFFAVYYSIPVNIK